MDSCICNQKVKLYRDNITAEVNKLLLKFCICIYPSKARHKKGVVKINCLLYLHFFLFRVWKTKNLIESFCKIMVYYLKGQYVKVSNYVQVHIDLMKI